MSRRRVLTVEQVVALHEDAERCARAAGLVYVTADGPGIRRLRRGSGFRYQDAAGRTVAATERDRIQALAIPPAWRKVWICPEPQGHLLAIGEDERGRRQYLYHEHWRAFRDELNFYRLIDLGPRLPAIRADVEAQLRRRSMDREQILAAMLRVIDAGGLRVGSEIYAEENDSYGLTTLTRRHVQVRGSSVRFDFPAKSGQSAGLTLRDPGVARVLAHLLAQRGRRLFTVAGRPIDADDVNDRLSELAGARVTAKDFRTWHGTRVAFAALRQDRPRHQLPPKDAEARALAAVDAAADFLGNTRAVARAHYVHPHVVQAYLDGRLGDLLRRRRPARTPGLDPDERALLPLLTTLLAERLGD
jgi:DNA topoisomerase-1